MPSVETVRQVRTPAAGATPPATVAPNSVFQAGQKAKRVYGPRNPVNPEVVQIRTGVPIPPRVTNKAGESAYARLFARMPVGAMVEVTMSQGNAFMKWAEKNAKGQILRRRLENGTAGCWRVAPGAEG